MASLRSNVIEIVILIALAVIAQVLVAVFSQVSVTAGNGLTGTALTNYNTAGTSITTVLNFMSIIFLIAAVVILLRLFGMENIFRFGREDK